MHMRVLVSEFCRLPELQLHLRLSMEASQEMVTPEGECQKGTAVCRTPVTCWGEYFDQPKRVPRIDCLVRGFKAPCLKDGSGTQRQTP